MGCFGPAELFLALCFTTVYFVHHYFSDGQLQIPSNLLYVITGVPCDYPAVFRIIFSGITGLI